MSAVISDRPRTETKRGHQLAQIKKQLSDSHEPLEQFVAAFQTEVGSAIRQRSRFAERQARLLAGSTRPVDRRPGQLRHPGNARVSVEWVAWSTRRFLDRGSRVNRCAAARHISN